jgi:lambda family phage minor tail protein L
VSTLADVRKYSLGQTVTLFQIVATSAGAPANYHFTNTVFEEGFAIKFGGNTYQHLACQLTGVSARGDGKPANPSFKIATGGGPVTSILQQYNDLKGVWLWRYETLAKYLDERPDGNGDPEVNPGADSSAIIRRELYVIDQKVASDNVFAEFKLVPPTDIAGAKLPGRIAVKNYCDKLYRYWNGSSFENYDPETENGCPYNGSDYYDDQDQTVVGAANDVPSKSLDCCIARFGYGVDLPFGGTPGIKRAGTA